MYHPSRIAIGLISLGLLMTVGCGTTTPNGNAGANTSSATGSMGGDTALLWSKTYGQEDHADGTSVVAKSIAATHDGYIIGGSWAEHVTRLAGIDDQGHYTYEQLFSLAHVTLANEPWIERLDTSGNVQWSKSYGKKTVCLEKIRGTAVDSEGNLISVGTVTLPDYSTDIGVMKIDNDGNVIWCRAYNTIRRDVADPSDHIDDTGYAITMLPDDSIVVAGKTKTRILNTGQFFYDTDAVIMRLTSDGNVTWQELFGNHRPDARVDETPTAVRAADDGGILVTGEADFLNGQTETKLFFLRLGNDGTLRSSVPERTGGTFAYQFSSNGYAGGSAGTDIGQLPNGTLVAAGYTELGRYGFTLIDASGHAQNTFNIGYASGTTWVMVNPTAGDGFYLANWSSIDKVDVNGATIWHHDLGNGRTAIGLSRSTTDALRAMIRTADGHLSTVEINSADGSERGQTPIIEVGELLDQRSWQQMIADGHGGWLLSGNISSDGSGRIIHADSNGRILWQRNVGDRTITIGSAKLISNTASFDRLITLPDGGILAGVVQYAGQGPYEVNFIHLFRLDADGNLTCQTRSSTGITSSCWQKTIERGDINIIDRRTVEGLNNLQINPTQPTTYDVFTKTGLYHFDQAGVVQWAVYKPGITAGIAVPNGYLLFEGSTLHIVDAAGHVTLEKKINNTPPIARVTSIVALENNNAVIAGILSDGKIFVAKLADATNDNSQFTWVRTLSDWNHNESDSARLDMLPSPIIQRLADGTISLAIQTDTMGGGTGGNIWLLKFSTDGTILTQKTFSTAGNDAPAAMASNPAGGLILVAETDGVTSANDAWVLSINNDFGIDSECPNGLGTDTAVSATNLAPFTFSRSNGVPPTSATHITPRDIILAATTVEPLTTRQCTGAVSSRPAQSAAPSRTINAAPSREGYTPGQETTSAPTANPGPFARIKASFTKKWDQHSGVLELDASGSTPGYQYSWYFGWSVGANTGTPPSTNPKMTTQVFPKQLDGPGKNWVVLNLMNDKRQIVASDRQLLN